jgi:hypothetical protein
MTLDIADVMIKDAVRPGIEKYHIFLDDLFATEYHADLIPPGDYMTISFGRAEYASKIYVLPDNQGLVQILREPRAGGGYQHKSNNESTTLYLRYLNVPVELREQITARLTPKPE